MLDVKTRDNRHGDGMLKRGDGAYGSHLRHAPIGAARAITPRAHEHARVGRAEPASPTRSTRRTRKPVTGRFAQSEARLLGVIVGCASVVCGLFVVYLAAYAQVASLGIRQSHAVVQLRDKKLEAETLQAACAVAASPDKIRAAAVKNGMQLEHVQRIAYVTTGGGAFSTAKPAAGGPAASATAQTADAVSAGRQTGASTKAPAELPSAGESVRATDQARVASRGTITDNFTTAAPVAN